jgi:HEAT repeat protein
MANSQASSASSSPRIAASHRIALPSRALCLLLLLTSAAFRSARCEEAAKPPAIPAPAAPDQQAEDARAAEAAKRKDTIRYGIDAEILELLRKLETDKDGSLNDELSALLARTRSPKLRMALIDLFASLEWRGAEAAALKLVEDRDLVDPGSAASALGYLAAIRSKDALKFSEALIKEDDKKLLPALIRLMGRAGGKDEEGLLLGWFESDAATEALRLEAIKALGEMGSAKAAERLAAIAKDPEKNKATRMSACDALGKIKDPGSVPALVDAANGEDPNVRAQAVEALASFEDETSSAAIVEALRDSFIKSRIAACKAIASRRIASADPFLRYKAASDPDRSVRNEALKALAALGGEAFAYLRERMGDKKAELQARALCFGLLMRKDASASMGALSAALAAEAAEKERSVYTAYVRELSNATDAPEAAPLARIILADKDPLMRVGSVEWARKSKAKDFKPELEGLAKDDPSEMIRKRAVDTLATLAE